MNFAFLQRARLQTTTTTSSSSSSSTSFVQDPDAYSIESDPSPFIGPVAHTRIEIQDKEEVGSEER